jgi:hypothetical protein
MTRRQRRRWRRNALDRLGFALAFVGLFIGIASALFVLTLQWVLS